MNREIILRLRSPQGQNRLTVRDGDTYGQLILKLSRTLGYGIKDLIVRTEDGRQIPVADGKKIREIPYFRDGAILKVDTMNPKNRDSSHHGVSVPEMQKTFSSSKCNHAPGGKCLNCIGGDSKQAKSEVKQKEVPKCNHGPGGRCLNCAVTDDKDKQVKMKWMCQHGPNAKCVNCLDKEYISDIAHISFDQFLQDKKLKCKGVHPGTVTCGNCLPPSEIRYEVDQTCQYHEPYPKAMCNKCIPPSVVIKRQQYRHVDYVEFMNVGQLSNFVKYWVHKKHMAEQRVGFLYGYYAEDPHYKGGIRVIVEAIYEPKQKGTYNTFEILESSEQIGKVERVVEAGLALEKVGWIYTENNHDLVMSQQKIRMAAKYQQNNQVTHSSGYPISNFVTVILRNDEKNNGDVKPEVYMISDQGEALEKHNLFVESDDRKMMHVRVPKSKEALPSFICGGKKVTEFEPEYLLVKIGHGSSNSNRFAYLKKSDFPCRNQQKITKADLKEYLKKNKHKESHVKYADFNLLLHLADLIDMNTAISIATAVFEEKPVADALDDFVMQTAEL